MKRPDARIHMALWGFFSGFIVADLYITFVYDSFQNFDELQLLTLMSNPLVLLFSLLYGILLGGFFGLINAKIIERVLGTGNADDGHGMAFRIYRNVFFTSFFGFSVLLAVVAFIGLCFFFLLPQLILYALLIPLITSILAVYSAHRYLFRLRLWSEHEFGAQKEKAKNIEQLEGTPGVAEIYFDEAESKRHEAS